MIQVADIFRIYWEHIGLPLSLLKGLVVDRIPFSVVEILSWVLLLSLLYFFWRPILEVVFGKGIRLKKFNQLKPITPFRSNWVWLIPIVSLILLLAWGQGIPWGNPWPSFRRPGLLQQPRPDLLFYHWKENLQKHQHLLISKYNPKWGSLYNQDHVLNLCNSQADQVLELLGLPEGRPLEKLKVMGPLNSFFAKVYGGPAFHDPFTGETGIIAMEQHPTTRAWRHLAICHEVTHAKGFTREIDAEILTFLILQTSKSPYLKWLASLTYLRHSGLRFQVPTEFKAELISARIQRKILQKQQPLTQAVKSWVRRKNLHNSSKKYGYNDPKQKWNPQHPYFSSIEFILSVFFEPQSKGIY